MNNNSIQRRTFLRGAGVSIALPFMESLLPRSSWAVEKASRLHRMAVVSVPFDMVIDECHPTKAGPDYELTSTLQPLSKYKSDFTVFSNFEHGMRCGHGANHTFAQKDQDHGTGGFPRRQPDGGPTGGRIGGPPDAFPFFGFLAGRHELYPGRAFGYLRLTSRCQAFRLLFVDSTETERKYDRNALASSGSILDAVRVDARWLITELGSEDQAKLEEYFTSIRETDKKLELADDWVRSPQAEASRH